ncbi:MAG TPA: O-antigen ligase family protein [Gemmatimonadaceae bacterium]|nr:O-antigen ligase family protein [Gemmatimonadaceae bacterium]
MTTATYPAFQPRQGTGEGPDIIDRLVAFLLIVFLVFFFVGERIETLVIPIRIEDFMFILLLPLSYRYLARPKTKLFYWIAAYFVVNLIPYTAAIIAGEYSLGSYPIIMVKEIEYFYIAFLITELRSKWVFATVDSLALFIIGNGLRALYQGEISYYGIGTFGNYSAPSLAGALYLFSTVWLHIRSKLVPGIGLRWVARMVVVAGAICVVATISRSSIAALLVYASVYMLLAHAALVPLFVAGLGLSPKVIQAIALLAGTGYGTIATRVVARASRIGNSALDRSGKWEYYMSLFEPMDFVFGRGKGYPNALDGTYGLGVDSQYIRTVMENGFVGVVILAAIFWIMLEDIRRHRGEFQHAWALVMAMFVMSVPLEALQVSKSGGFFWLAMFYMLRCQRRFPAHRLQV